MNPKLLIIATVLIFTATQPRAALLAAAVTAAVTFAAVRMLLNHCTVFAPARARWS